MAAQLPKASLYYAKPSIWCAAVFLALEEKGYGQDDLYLKEIDISTGSQYSLSFLRLNPHATVPTLVVPYTDSLSSEVEGRYKALTDTKSVIEFLDKSRSTTSPTRSTSSAPAPSLAPATVAFASKSAAVIDAVHSDDGDPNKLTSLNARDTASLRILAKKRLASTQNRSRALEHNLQENETDKTGASEKTKTFWRQKKEAVDRLLHVYLNADKSDVELSELEKKNRDEYFAEAKDAWETKLKAVLIKVNDEMIGPFVLGDQLSVADLHLAAWIARLVKLAGGAVEDNGHTAIAKLSSHIGAEFILPANFTAQWPGQVNAATSKLAAFWDAVKERQSWKKVYADALR